MPGRGRRDGESATEWDGRKVYTGADLAAIAGDPDDPDRVDDPGYYRRRLRHGVVLGVVALLLVAMGVTGYLVLTKQVTLPFLPEPQVTASSAAPEPACPPEQRTYLDITGVTVNVLNATSRPGLAEKTRAALVERGFRPGGLGDARLPARGMTGMVLSGPDGYDAALTVQRQLPGAVYQRDPEMTGTTVTLVVGEGYEALLPADQVSAEPGTLYCG